MSATTAHARLAALALSCAWGIISLSTGINALAKSDSQKRALKHAVPAVVSVRIDTDDVLDSGIVVTVVCGLIALVSFLSLLHALFFRFRIAKRGDASRPLHTRHAPRAGALLLAFLSVWLFATLVPFTDFVANRSAKVTATLGGTALSPQEIQAYQDALGLTSVYHKLGYRAYPRLEYKYMLADCIRVVVTATVLPWITLLFASLASLLSLVYARQASRATVTARNGPEPRSGYADEKTAEQQIP